MSRSRRKTPVVGITTAKSEKDYKSAAHRQERTMAKRCLRRAEEVPGGKSFGDPWNGDKDGKQWLGDRFPELLRK